MAFDDINGIVANSYKCKACGETGNTPLEIKHKEDCARLTEQKARRLRDLILVDLNASITPSNNSYGGLTNWGGTHSLAERIIRTLHDADALK